MKIRTSDNYRSRLRLLAGGSEKEVEAVWGDDDVLRCATEAGIIEIPDEGVSVLATLVRKLEARGYDVQCCATCRFSWYAGLGADSGSMIGNCMLGKKQRIFGADDYVHLTGICDSYTKGADEDRESVFIAIPERHTA